MTGLWFEKALIEGGWADQVRLKIKDGRIASIEVGVEPGKDDERHGVALPGMPNLHSHAFQRGMAGLAERKGGGSDSFWTWRDLMYRFANRIGPDEMQAIAALAFVEMLESGFTHVGEFHYVHRDVNGLAYGNPAEMGWRLAAAAADTGIGLTLLPVLYMASGFGSAQAKPEQARFLHDLDGYSRLIEASALAAASVPGGRIGLAPHSLRAVPPELFPRLPQLLQDGMPVHIHVAEQVAEVADCLAATGARPVQWLLDNVAVDSEWCLVHATHVDEHEKSAIAASGAVVGLCPITEANLGDGIFPAIGFGGRFGVGSDSNILIDMAEELRLLEYGQRLSQRARSLMSTAQMPSTGRYLFEQAGRGGGQALGCGFGLSAGNSADFVTLRRGDPTLLGKDEDYLLDTLIFAHRRGMIDGVWRAGRQWVKNGTHLARSSVEERFVSALAALEL